LDTQAIIAHTRRWIAGMVIELNLCPFARRVFQADTIRYVVSATEDERALIQDLDAELSALAKTPIEIVETTLLIHPCVLADFLAYNDFLDTAEARVETLGLRGIVQIASFHPNYQFAGTQAEDVENYTNRSPYPMLHLLREESVTAVANDPDELSAIPVRNIEALQSLGREKILARLRAIKEGL
jgi:hypothetical protein